MTILYGLDAVRSFWQALPKELARVVCELEAAKDSSLSTRSELLCPAIQGGQALLSSSLRAPSGETPQVYVARLRLLAERAAELRTACRGAIDEGAEPGALRSAIDHLEQICRDAIANGAMLLFAPERDARA